MEFKHEDMTEEEKESIRVAVRNVESALRKRLELSGANESEINSSLYGIQDWLGFFDVDDQTLNYPE